MPDPGNPGNCRAATTPDTARSTSSALKGL